jgi:hypothetical protein
MGFLRKNSIGTRNQHREYLNERMLRIEIGETQDNFPPDSFSFGNSRWPITAISSLGYRIYSNSLVTQFFAYYFSTKARWLTAVPVGKSAGIGISTFPVAAHCAPRCKAVINPTHSTE